MRKVLDTKQVNETAMKSIVGFHPEYIKQVEEAIQKNDYVVVGMSLNPFCKKAQKLLTANGLKYEYIELGGYMSMWKQRLAVKLWSGWPTFPMVFVKGQLIGGFQELKQFVQKS